MIYLNSENTSPSFNLALEEYVFDHIEEDVFMLWQNDNTIVCGRYQNTIQEISARFVKENGIRVVRRLSGGGAVYHDMGNINFTFITDSSQDNLFQFEHFTRHIVDLLRTFGVAAEFNSRNDLTVAGRKFSGNAQYVRNGRVLHHGTLLFDSRLETLVHALNVSEAKIESKAIRSIHERVTNLKEHMDREVTIEAFRNAIRNYIFRSYPAIREYHLPPEGLKKVQEIEREKYATWEWNYGESPASKIVKSGKSSGGFVEVRFTLEEGKIADIHFFGDFFASDEFPRAVRSLIGAAHTEEGLAPGVARLAAAMSGIDAGWLRDLILS